MLTPEEMRVVDEMFDKFMEKERRDSSPPRGPLTFGRLLRELEGRHDGKEFAVACLSGGWTEAAGKVGDLRRDCLGRPADHVVTGRHGDAVLEFFAAADVRGRLLLFLDDVVPLVIGEATHSTGRGR